MQRIAFLTLCCVSVKGWTLPKPYPRIDSPATAYSILLPLTVNHCHPSIRNTLMTGRDRSTKLKYSSSDDKNEDDNESSMDRMQVVRSLQASFYKSSDGDFPAQTLDLSRGIFHNLPLWRVQWHEVPGRTNVLNVHEGIYTNMFERILHQKPPWYVGHLYLPEGSANLSSKDCQHKLCTWEERISGDITLDRDKESAVVGTILRITDYRRMMDGRLLLLVQAMERFVVADVRQQIPYSVANVQIIPDTEEIEESDWRTSRAESDVFTARALAVQESFERWHRYEHENTMLPLPMQPDLDPSEVLGSALAKVLPYSPFSSVTQVSTLRHEILKDPTTSAVKTEPDQRILDADYTQITLEERLVRGRILADPCLDPALSSFSMDELETRLWLALNDFLKATRTPVSPVLLGLLPINRVWPADFVLERVAQAVEEQTQLDHKYVRVSAEYPSLRRQKRLSYCAAALLEKPDSVNSWRRQLLAIPSTKDRLTFVLQRFETEFGAFQ